MLELWKILATLCAGLWTGAALYIGLIEHPSSVKLGLSPAVEYFRHMSKRTAPFMMLLSATSGVAACWTWWLGSETAWLVGGLLQIGMFPLTAVFIVPTNIKLIKIDPLAQPDQTTTLLNNWGNMHWLRVAVGSAAFPLFLWQL